MDTVNFQVDGIGEFSAYKELPAYEEMLLEAEVNSLFNGQAPEMAARATILEEQIRTRILKDKFGLDGFPEDPQPEFIEKFETAFERDTSLEKRVVETIRLPLRIMRIMLRLDRVLVKKPPEIEHIRDLTDTGSVIRIWIAYMDALRPFREPDTRADKTAQSAATSTGKASTVEGKGT